MKTRPKTLKEKIENPKNSNLGNLGVAMLKAAKS